MKAKALPKITIKDLEWNSETRTYEWITRAVEPVFMRPNGDIVLSAEDYPQVADYYGELSDGLPWIAPELERWAEDNGGFWEWESAGSLVFCED